MSPTTIASTFSVQKISRHHYLIRGDERIKDYMNFCDTKWSKTYQGWIVHEDDEVDLLQMHMEVLDCVKDSSEREKKAAKKKQKESKRKVVEKSKKSSKSKRNTLYDRMKRGEELSDDEEDEDYEPSSESPGSSDQYETEEEEEDSDEEESEDEESEEEEDSDEEDSSDEESEEEEETDPKRKKEYQFYKKGILAYGKMTERQKEKLEAIWNKYLKGWIIHKNYLEKLQKMGWVELDEAETVPEAKKEKAPTTVETKKDKPAEKVIHYPKVTRKPKPIESKEPVAGANQEPVVDKQCVYVDETTITPEKAKEIGAVYHPGLKGYLLAMPKQVKIEEPVKISFTQGEKLVITQEVKDIQ
jgi:hypothetical protein